ncbi:glycerophosphodiester phosphodiesterase [Actinopolyspora mortivallis]|uniref:glycerophosphodiester phosphodiesterase n=1 Tax=Actinopolyspora mortivallis TaxID=33906 RepID=UPI0003A13DB4|nr:glycerophosphodiester phosphodiesterase [Actinopolyspora mortivallis]
MSHSRPTEEVVSVRSGTRSRTGALLCALALSVCSAVALAPQAGADRPGHHGRGHPGGESLVEVFGHRGASGYRPEHTLASYELAARMGADYIEPDLVPTKDGALVARHENEISGTTDVEQHPEFADRRTTKVVDGNEVTGWFTEDFTLAELKTLRATERLPELRQENTIHDGRYEIPTLQEIIDLKRELSRELGRRIGLAPEIKHPSYFRSAGLAVEPRLVWALNRNGLNTPWAKVAVQSFEVGNLQWLHRRLRVDLVQLVWSSGAPYDFVDSGDPRTYADMVTPEGMRDIAKYADWVAPVSTMILPRDERGYLTEPTRLVDNAHEAGLKVVTYTVRAENTFLPADFRSSGGEADHGDVFGFLDALFATGVDGVFADQPDLAVRARDAWHSRAE